jgi:hypothetical protein
MGSLAPTFAFEGDQVYALFEGRVIAKGKADKVDEVEKTAVEYLDALDTERKAAAKQSAVRKATHVITPNGLKGQILGKVDGLWTDEITVRFENGEIRTMAAHPETQYLTEHTASGTPAEALKARLDADFDRSKAGLRDRVAELEDIRRTASTLIAKGAAYEHQRDLDQIVVAAEHEAVEVGDALQHLEQVDAEAMRPPTMDYGVAEQADLGPGAGNNWLDHTVQDMIDEAQGTDFDKLVTEGPALFVTELDNGALADAGTTREMALSHVVSKTAGYEGDGVDEYRELFLARTEQARRQELAARVDRTEKTAAAEENLDDVPDEALFS